VERGVPRRWLSRRAVLAGSSALGVAFTLSACVDQEAERAAAAPDPDDPAVARTIAGTRALLTSAQALATAGGVPRSLAQQLVADHTAHLAALGAPAGAFPASSTAPPATFTTPPADPGGQLDQEWAAGREALRDALDADVDGFAVLLARIAACRAVHADLLATTLKRKALPALIAADPVITTPSTPTPSGTAVTPGSSPSPIETSAPAATPTESPTETPTGTPTDPSDDWQQALDRLLAGEHAAVFAYPLVIAQLSGSGRDRAQALWLAHQASRNELTELLVDAGAEPAVAEPAYRVSRPADAKAARRLGAAVEGGLVALAGDALAVGEDRRRRELASDHLVLAARRSAQWSGRAIALPGLPARPASSAPAPTGSRTPSPT